MLVGPLFDDDGMEKILELSEETWDMQHPKEDALLRFLIEEGKTSWLQSLATYAVGEIGAANRPDIIAPVEPQREEATSPPAKKRRRRNSPDIFGALIDEPTEKEEPSARSRSRQRPDPLGRLLGEHNEDSSSNGLSEEGSGQNDSQSLVQATKPALPSKNGKPHGPLFAPDEIEALLTRATNNPHEEVRAAAKVANRLLSGQRISDWLSQEEVMLSSIEKIIFLKEVPFFQGMTVEQLKVLANVCEEEFFPADTRIYTENDAGGILYVVVSGRVGIEREGMRKGSYARVGTVEAHSYFGEMNLFDNSARDATAIAIQDTLTLRLRREPLIALARQHPELSLKLINVLSERLRDTTAQVANLTRSRPRELHKLFDQFD